MLSARGMLKARHAWHGTLGTARIARQIVRQTADAVGNADSNAEKLHDGMKGRNFCFRLGNICICLLASVHQRLAPQRFATCDRHKHN